MNSLPTSEKESNKCTNGPDQIIDSHNYITWKQTEAVKIRMGTEAPGNYAPISVPGLMMKTVEEVPDHPAMKRRDDHGQETVWTYREYLDEVKTMAKTLIDLGLDRLQSVCILGHNSPEWVIAGLATMFAGGIGTGIYPTSGPDACRYILEHSKCGILVVEDQKQLDKVWHFRNELPNLKTIVQYSGVPTKEGVLSWKDLLAHGRCLGEELLEARLRRIAINQCCALVYTSGTTGNPKGVMLSHDNVTWFSRVASETLNIQEGSRVLSYLPLSHVIGLISDVFLTMINKGTTFFANKNALTGTLLDDLHWCRPTEFVGSPLTYEKLMEGMKAKDSETKGFKKTIAMAAREAGTRYHLEGGNDIQHHLTYAIFNKLVFSKVKEELGLDQCRIFLTGATPMDKETFDFFLAMDIKILNGFGMSEVTGPHTMMTPKNWKPSSRFSAGKTLASTESKLATPTNADITEDKELCMWGRHVMMGYKDREEATRKEMTEDGWMRSGDLFKIDSDGYHYIVGRDKDLIIPTAGVNIPPQPIEEAVKAELPCVSQVLVLGDRQRFLSCFLTLKVDVDRETMSPTRRLTATARAWCRSVGSEATTVEDVLAGPDRRVMSAIQAGLDAVNRWAVNNVQMYRSVQIQKWTLLPNDFSLPGGELGPTMKVNKKVVVEKYRKQIDYIYGRRMIM